MASDAGLEPLAGPRDMAKARGGAARSAGYRGETVVLMVPSTSAELLRHGHGVRRTC